METITVRDQNKKPSGLDQYGRKYVFREFTFIVIHFIVLLISAGTIGWINAWIYFGLGLAFKLISNMLLISKNPELLNERGRFIKKDTKPFDKVFFGFYVPLNFAIVIISGLDAVRYEWTSIPLEVNVIGALCLMVAFTFVTWAMSVNTHFEATVRIQDDRDHQVCSAGPYKIVRHPGYAGAISGLIGLPLLLGSTWALVPSTMMILLFIIRTFLEDRTLQMELSGYRAYSKETRYRLLPYVW